MLSVTNEATRQKHAYSFKANGQDPSTSQTYSLARSLRSDVRHYQGVPSPDSRLVDESHPAEPADGVVDAELGPGRQRCHADTGGVRRAAHFTHELTQLRVRPARVDDLRTAGKWEGERRGR